MLIAWVVTALVLFYGDRFLDARLSGPAPKRPGPVPFWWVFVVALTAGAVMATASGDAVIPKWAQVVGLVFLLAASAAAFCVRFGLRPGRGPADRT